MPLNEKETYIISPKEEIEEDNSKESIGKEKEKIDRLYNGLTKRFQVLFDELKELKELGDIEYINPEGEEVSLYSRGHGTNSYFSINIAKTADVGNVSLYRFIYRPDIKRFDLRVFSPELKSIEVILYADEETINIIFSNFKKRIKEYKDYMKLPENKREKKLKSDKIKINRLNIYANNGDNLSNII